MKKYRVTCSNGNIEIIEAENMDAAISIARKKFGKLPNEVNKEISSEIIKKSVDLVNKLKEHLDSIKENSRVFSWDDVYRSADEISKMFTENGEEIGSLCKKLKKVKGNEEV